LTFWPVWIIFWQSVDILTCVGCFLTKCLPFFSVLPQAPVFKLYSLFLHALFIYIYIFRLLISPSCFWFPAANYF
jgi:hypothetical protein